jgi:3-methyladenine DNA glycosylase AlkD
MTVQSIMSELKSFGDEGIKKILLKHGVKEPFFGVRVEHLKTIQKKVKKDYQLAKDLYATGNADAMYLAGLIADDEKMTKEDLRAWAKQALSSNINEYTVPWVATGSKHGFGLAKEWIDDKEEHIVVTGWATFGNLVALIPDKDLDIAMLKSLMARVTKTIHDAPNRVRQTMNGFIAAVGIYVPALTDEAVATAKKIAPLTARSAEEQILKVKAKGTLGKKKKTVKC